MQPSPEERVTTEQEAPGRAGMEEEKISEQEMASIKTTEVEEPKVARITEEEKAEIFKDIHFDFDRYDIREDDRPTLKRIADWLIEHPDVKLIIEGHCDERGTNEYNLGLGDRRASAAKQYLLTLGVSSSRLQTVSYGEERPLCTEHNEDCWWRNRRAHFVVIQGQ
ncbi:MAG: peptidoglycan-associated lipoprotein Pal [Nitrospirae bacterium]|nr:MAG: peptidoglycan-associated lipoprotein Pal [Nitrospirota bacterium]